MLPVIQRDQKRVIGLAAALLTILVCLSMVFISATNRWSAARKANAALTEKTQNAFQQQEELPQYVIASYQNKVAVFEYGKGYPVEIFDVYLDSLPASDVLSIQKGIPVRSTEELRAVIEDFTS